MSEAFGRPIAVSFQTNCSIHIPMRCGRLSWSPCHSSDLVEGVAARAEAVVGPAAVGAQAEAGPVGAAAEVAVRAVARAEAVAPAVEARVAEPEEEVEAARAAEERVGKAEVGERLAARVVEAADSLHPTGNHSIR